MPARETVVAKRSADGSGGTGGGPVVNIPTSPAGRAMIAGVAALFVLLGGLVVLSSKPGVSASKRIAPYTEQKRKAAEVMGFGPAKISTRYAPSGRPRSMKIDVVRQPPELAPAANPPGDEAIRPRREHLKK